MPTPLPTPIFEVLILFLGLLWLGIFVSGYKPDE